MRDPRNGAKRQRCMGQQAKIEIGNGSLAQVLA